MRTLVAAGAVVIGVAMALALLPGRPAACGSLLAPAIPHAVRACAEAQGAFVPALVDFLTVGLLTLEAEVVALPSRPRQSGSGSRFR
ncbi:hypothetical protein [Amnibacterium sp.]|uniref:hypothetical protein n=1 Tax=Amnibacterium sp. TaxID=1872496 RepID=UPI002606B40C|nr:hypothetical protein [Amnibacterium sp.]MCU1474844.1 hypothetical protein [Amnibacterium sp.]